MNIYEAALPLAEFTPPVSIDASQVDLSRVNPYNRHLPPGQEDVLRESKHLSPSYQPFF